MLSKDGGLVYDTERLAAAALADAASIEGVSIIGGEPFAQAEACADFAERVRAGGLSVVTFTGYPYETLKSQEECQRLLEATDLLVDGQFDRHQPETERRWVGSANQRLIFLTDRYSALDSRFYESNTVEIRYRDGEVTINGWPIFEVSK
jgi:anaerobic ribonucleoside-triphosphate reductase activating protein